MMGQAGKQRLGRGLAALIGNDTNEESVIQDARSLRHVPIEFLKGSPTNPRKFFGDEEIDELAKSIKDKGLLQPLVVRSGRGENTYEIVAGERRWRAAQRAGLHEVPVLIRELNDAEMLEIALIENIQRSDLNPLEEAAGYVRLIDEFGYTQQQLAKSIGKSRSHIANTMRLLSLPESVRDKVEKGTLSAGHARPLIAADNPEELAEKIVKLGMSVREAEKLIKRPAPEVAKSKPGKAAQKQKSADVRALEGELSSQLGLAVSVSQGKGESGTVTIGYKTLEQLEMVCRKLNSPTV